MSVRLDPSWHKRRLRKLSFSQLLPVHCALLHAEKRMKPSELPKWRAALKNVADALDTASKR